MKQWTAEEVERTLREVSQLRQLALRLPRMATLRRMRRREEFRKFVAGIVESCSCEALEQGFEELWEAADAAQILQLVARYPGELSLGARTFVELARQSLGSTP